MSISILKVLTNYNINEDTCIIVENRGIVHITGFLNSSVLMCPLCNSGDIVKNGHIKKHIKDCTNYIKEFDITIYIQRFKCKKCSSIFYEENPYTNKYEVISKSSIHEIMNRLAKPNETFDSIGKDMRLPGQTISNIFDKYYAYEVPSTLPSIISFDEKSTKNDEIKSPYIFIMVDFLGRKIYDILPSRHKQKLLKYFSKIPSSERNKVKYVTMDMWDPYRDVVQEMFKNAIIAVDSFHVIQNLNRAIDRVRIIIMQKYNKNTENLEDNHPNYILLKKYFLFFQREFDDITDCIYFVKQLHEHMSKHKLLNTMLDIDPRLRKAYELCQEYREFNKTATSENARELLEDFIDRFLNSNENSLITFGTTLCNWKEEIINSFITVKDLDENDMECDRRLSNGLIEKYNGTIKQIQSNARGFGNIWRMKNRITLVINRDYDFENENPEPVSKEKRTPKFKR